MNIHPLNNPVFNALVTEHAVLGSGNELARRYLSNILPFVGTADNSLTACSALNDLLDNRERFFLLGELHALPFNWKVVAELTCLQMILDSSYALLKDDLSLEKLCAQHQEDLFELVNEVQPGYFRKESMILGNYFGIFCEGQLVSAGGERMRMPKFKEISAICTRPAFRGRSYAQKIMSKLCAENLNAGNTPFLHVLKSNTNAIRIYEKLGFQVRRTMKVYHLEKTKLKFPSCQYKFINFLKRRRVIYFLIRSHLMVCAHHMYFPFNTPAGVQDNPHLCVHVFAF